MDEARRTSWKSGCLFLLALLASYCAILMRTVATITITVVDQNGAPVEDDVIAEFVSADGTLIVAIDIDQSPSWSNNIHWWSHSSHEKSLLKPRDAIRTKLVRIKSTKCEEAKLPVELARQYEGLSFAPHGGGPAYMLYTFENTVKLTCKSAETIKVP